MITNNIKTKLEKTLKKISIDKRIEHGMVIDYHDIKTIFTILRKYDKEVNPLLNLIELFLIKEQDIEIKEDVIKSCLMYYNILDNNDFINCRHKYFFTQKDKKLIKKPFFTEKVLNDIKQEFILNGIFKKI
jgi:hypothetical protein